MKKIKIIIAILSIFFTFGTASAIPPMPAGIGSGLPYSAGIAANLPGSCSAPAIYYATDTGAYYQCGSDGTFALSSVPNAADGSRQLLMGNNSTFSPTASTYGLVFVAGVPKFIVNGALQTALTKAQVFSNCTTVKALVATDDFPVAIFPYAITITGVRIYHIGSTDLQGQFDECTGTSGVCTSLTPVDVDIDATVASVWTANTSDGGVLDNPGIAANNGIWWHTTSVTGTNTFATMCFYYTID
jgi:hypothetical protein